ncbi:SDR family NAD(P)-dependent oxidoreductase [Mycobacterium genavense]|uniref:SDR family NAD(P)-dependent oxidoreductase n=1 Tax=Mycobacterium genavense TaxID=36812 RepID=UPI000565A4FE|nr:SDR family NAD(P)-dependent oxidoreductase [Mycobacterium genavense]
MVSQGALAGRVVLVTGGGRGIGRAHCLELAAQGAAVVVNDPGVTRDGVERDADPAAEVVAEIEEKGGRAIAHTGSVASWSDVADMVGSAVETFGVLTGVVNNAGIVRDAMVLNATDADWDAVMAVHLKGTFAVTKHAMQYWRAQAKGGNQIAAHVVNTVSGAGLWGNVGQGAYGAAKAAIANLTHVTAIEGSRYGVAANAISPLATTRISESFFSKENSQNPALDPARSSAVVAWLQSADSSWLSGQILRVNGSVLSRIEGFTEAPDRYQAQGPDGLQFSEIGAAVRRLYHVAPRGLAGGGG